MSSIDFSNWILTSFATVDEVRAAVESGEVAVAPTLLPGWPPTVQPFHWIVYDKSGKAWSSSRSAASSSSPTTRSACSPTRRRSTGT